jgi:hypothetical protein
MGSDELIVAPLSVSAEFPNAEDEVQTGMLFGVPLPVTEPVPALEQAHAVPFHAKT